MKFGEKNFPKNKLLLESNGRKIERKGFLLKIFFFRNKKYSHPAISFMTFLITFHY